MTDTKPYDITERLRTPEEMAEYLIACAEDGGSVLLRKAVNDVIAAASKLRAEGVQAGDEAAIQKWADRFPEISDMGRLRDAYSAAQASAPQEPRTWHDDYKHDGSMFQRRTKPSAPVAGLPERDTTKSAEAQGLFRKFDVRRTDGSDAPGGKHHGCRYFVLDVDHDRYAPAALGAYAALCEADHPDLARDLREKWGAPVAGEAQAKENYDEVKATLQGAHRIMEGVAAIERRVGPLGSHARGYTHKITNALRHLDMLYAAPQASAEALEIARAALMEIADLADVEADQRGVIVNQALTRIARMTAAPKPGD